MRNRAVLAAVVALAAAGGTAAAGDPAEQARARDRRAVLEQMKKGASGPTIAGALAALADQGTAVLAAEDCIVVADDAVREALVHRDTQGRELYTYYKAHYATRSDPSDKEIRTYEALEVKNRDACRAVRERERDLDSIQAAGRAAGERVTGDDAAFAALADAVRAAIRPVRYPETRARMYEALAGPLVAPFSPDLEKAALKGESREERVAALHCMTQIGTRVRVAAIAPCVADEDSFVRRAAFPAVAAAASKDAVDVLVARMPHEIGVPARELSAILARLTGQTFGDSGKAWTDWWAGARDAWDGPPAVPPAEKAAATKGTHYFGLVVESTRVLFVIDRSWSMECGVGYDGKNDLTLLDGEQKITVARRELIQAITGLAEGASFNIVAFGSSTKPFSPRLVEATQDNRHKATWWVEHLELDGNTNMGGALIESFESLLPGSHPKDSEIADTIVVLTDGVPNCGPIGHPDDVLDEVRRRNRDHTVTIHAVYLGNEGNVEFLKRLAEDNSGQFVHHAK
jgi:hypothetical protein